MRNSIRKGAFALVTVTALGLWSIAGVAVADPKPDHVDHGQHLGHDKPDKDKADKDKDGDRDADKSKDSSKDEDKGAKPDHGQGHANTHATGHGDPGGNNGTVKIAGPADEVGHPSNNPHPGCTLVVEWFGFDDGPDVVSTVSFASHAPTSDVVLGGTSPAAVFVGGDPAGGGTDLDGRQAYTLTFSGGEPHPKQGFHIKLTVHTPHAHGNDSKSKVFWVAPCESGTTTSEGAGGAGGPRPNGDRGASSHSATADAQDQAVDAEAGAVPAAPGNDTAAVPTAVDAGEDESVLPEWARSPLPLTLVAFGLVLTAVGIVLRNRSRA